MTKPLRQYLLVAILAYGVALAVMVFFPTPVDRPIAPLIERVVAWSQGHGAGWVTYGSIEFASNIAMFVPFGFLTALAFGRRYWWLALLVCPLASVVIETAQLIILPSRTASLRDVLANSSGALIGIALALPLARGRLSSTGRQRRTG